MTTLTPVDGIEVQILVDNTTDSLSSIPRFVESEFSYLRRKGMRVLSGKCICCASHGLSCLITAHRGEETRTLLFDTGPEADVFERNVARLGLDLSSVQAVVLSHGHWDHAGGMVRAIEMIRARQAQGDLPFYGHPGMFRTRGRQLPDGSVLPMEDVPSPEALTAAGARVVLAREAQGALDGTFHVSGEIPRVTSFETGLPFHMAQTADGGWEDDPLIMDERWIAVHVRNRGLVVFTACSHAGVVNVLHDVRRTFPEIPMLAVVGGLHLSGPTEAIIPQTVAALAQFGLTTIAAGHCTGWRAMSALAAEFGDATLAPLAVGKRLMF